MSIIHDALKKVQQKLAPKTDASEATPASLDNLYVTPTPVETLPTPAIQQEAAPKPRSKFDIKNVLTLCLAMAVIAGSGYYLYSQFKGNIPQVNNFARKEFYKIVYKKEPPPAFKTKAPEDLKPLAQLTIAPSKTSYPLTLNIHGIMANSNGNLVLINDQVYQEGDEVDGAKIVKINLDSIIVDVNGAQQTIFVKN
jgi:hypothetical protein